MLTDFKRCDSLNVRGGRLAAYTLPPMYALAYLIYYTPLNVYSSIPNLPITLLIYIRVT